MRTFFLICFKWTLCKTLCEKTREHFLPLQLTHSLYFYFIRSRNFKKKFKGKGDDAKRKFKPKKFSKDFRGENSPGQKRRANDTNADGYRKKWKGEIGSQDGKKGYGKGSRNSYVKGNFVGGDKAMKRKFSDGKGSDFGKKKNFSSSWENKNGEYIVSWFSVFCKLTLELLKSNWYQYLISPFDITSESNNQVTRIKEMITNWSSSWF